MDIWREELATALEGEQWRPALKLCSWLRYALSQQELSDPDVEKAHQQAKEGLAEQMAGEETEQQRGREREADRKKLRQVIMHLIIAGKWEEALDSIEEFGQDGVGRQEAVHLLQELKYRTATMLAPQYRQRDPKAAALGKRFDEVADCVGASLVWHGDRTRDRAID